MGWPSTVDYYRYLANEATRRARAAGHDDPCPVPEIVIESMNMRALRDLWGSPGSPNGWEAYDRTLREAMLRLRAAGAEILFIASNTPHQRWETITRGVGGDLVSILDTTSAAVAEAGCDKALVLGTGLTMTGAAYPQALKTHGIQALTAPVAPARDELDRLIEAHMTEDATADLRDHLLSLSREGVEDPATTAVCLACTELPQAFPDQRGEAVIRTEGLIFIDTAVAHAKVVLDRALT